MSDQCSNFLSKFFHFRKGFTTLTQDYFNALDVRDWSGFDFSRSSVLKLRECVEKVRKFSLSFTRINYPDLNSETIELMLAIEFEIRRRPLDEQYPEIWNPLKSANETLNRIATVQEAQNNRQQKHFDDHLESVFTNIALKYLREKNPHNTYVNVFENTAAPGPYRDHLQDDLEMAMRSCERRLGVRREQWQVVPDEKWH